MQKLESIQRNPEAISIIISADSDRLEINLTGVVQIFSKAKHHSQLEGLEVANLDTASNTLRLELADGTILKSSQKGEFKLEYSPETNPLLLNNVHQLILETKVSHTVISPETNALSLLFQNGACLTIYNPFVLQPDGTKPEEFIGETIVGCEEKDYSFILTCSSGRSVQVNLENPEPEAMVFTIPCVSDPEDYAYVVWN